MKYLFLLLSLGTLTKSYIFLNFHSTGLLLPYSLGITSYIKHHYNISNYKLRGISGGAFCALLFHYENKLDNYDDLCDILNIDKNSKIYLPFNLDYFLINAREKLKKRYQHKNLDIPISISTTSYNNYEKIEFNNFEDIDNLIELCYISSYIPLISGNSFYYKYKEHKLIDGYFNKKNTFEKGIDISYNMWNRKFKLIDFIYTDYNRSKILFELGWNDTKNNIQL